MESINASGLKLSASEIAKINSDIRSGMDITIGRVRPLAKVSGNVAPVVQSLLIGEVAKS